MYKLQYIILNFKKMYDNIDNNKYALINFRSPNLYRDKLAKG